MKVWWKKEQTLFSVWEPPMIYISMEGVGNSKLFSLVGKLYLPKCFYLSIFGFELWHLYKSLLPSMKGLSFTLCNFYFEFESPSSLIKHQLEGTMILLEYWV